MAKTCRVGRMPGVASRETELVVIGLVIPHLHAYYFGPSSVFPTMRNVVARTQRLPKRGTISYQTRYD